MRVGVWIVAGAAFLAMLLLDTQAVLQLGWMTALGRLGAWPQRLLLGVALAVVASRLVAAGLRRRVKRPGRRDGGRRAPKQAAAPAKAVRKGPPVPDPKGRKPAAPGMVATASRAPGRSGGKAGRA